MFSRNHGDEVLKASLAGASLHYSVTRDSRSGAITVKLVNPQGAPQTLQVDLHGVGRVKSTAVESTLAAAPAETNSLDRPTHVLPVTRKVSGVGTSFSHTVPAYSITVLRMDAR